jgi:ribosomal protein S8E
MESPIIVVIFSIQQGKKRKGKGMESLKKKAKILMDKNPFQRRLYSNIVSKINMTRGHFKSYQKKKKKKKLRYFNIVSKKRLAIASIFVN